MNARFFTLLTTLAVAGHTNAAIIYETLGPDPLTPAQDAHVTGWNHFGFGSSVAAPFSFTDAAYRLDSITLSVRLAGNEAAPNLEIGIYLDSGGFPSLTPVANIYPNPTFITFQRQLLTYSFAEHEVLAPNTPYWLVLQPRIFGTASEEFDADYSFAMATNLPNGGGAARTLPFPENSPSDGWATYNGAPPVFRLDGTAVPEPGTWALLGLGGALLWSATRRRRK
jgi:hypothetical protein